MTETFQNCDVCVVGGGPAGLATAIALRQDGFRVMLVDCAAPPVNKACGEGLMPDGLAMLGELGITVPSDLGFSFRGIQFSDATSTVRADFPNGHGIGLRRTILHDLLRRRAEELNVSFAWGAKHVTLTHGVVSVNGQLIKAGYVIGADGHASQIRSHAGLNQTRRERRRFGFRRHYQIAPWSSYMALHWGARSQIYVTPVSRNEVCLTVISRDPKLRLDQALADFPELRRRLGDAAHTSSEMGSLSVTRTLRRVYRDNVALVGDASGSVDAITGEGICLSFKQAIALAAALKSGRLAKYQKQHQAASRRPRLMSSLLLRLERHKRLQNCVLATLANRPRIFASLLAIHLGQPSRIALKCVQAVLIALFAITFARAQQIAVDFDPAKTKIGFTLTDPLHTVHGTFQLKQGHIEYQSAGLIAGDIIVDAATGDSGSQARDKRMHRNILESRLYPEIRFTPTKIDAPVSSTGVSSANVTGWFLIHGQRHEITVPMRINISGADVTTTAKFIVPYVQWGMKDPSTFILRVSNKVDIDVTAFGRLTGAHNP